MLHAAGTITPVRWLQSATDVEHAHMICMLVNGLLHAACKPVTIHDSDRALSELWAGTEAECPVRVGSPSLCRRVPPLVGIVGARPTIPLPNPSGVLGPTFAITPKAGMAMSGGLIKKKQPREVAISPSLCWHCRKCHASIWCH